MPQILNGSGNICGKRKMWQTHNLQERSQVFSHIVGGVRRKRTNDSLQLFKTRIARVLTLFKMPASETNQGS